MRSSRIGTVLAALVGALLLVTVAGCSLDPTRLPIPGAGIDGETYSIKIEFSSVLNLPAKAKVESGGVKIGELDTVELVGSTAVVTVDISTRVVLPVNARAELRQATLLGDIYIALFPPTDPAPEPLRAGDTIPLSNSVPADNVEDVLRSLSNLVTGGSIGQIQKAVVDVNEAFPSDAAELARIQTSLATSIHDLATNRTKVDAILTAAEQVSRTLVDNAPTLDRVLTEGPEKLEGLASVIFAVTHLLISGGGLMDALGPILLPVTPDLHDIFSMISPLVASVSTSDTTVPANVERLNALLKEKLVPFFASGVPAIDVVGISAAPGADANSKADDAITVLRTMGLAR